MRVDENNKRLLSRRDLKEKVLLSLRKDSLSDVLNALSVIPPKRTINHLLSYIQSQEDRVKWAAVAALGISVAELAPNKCCTADRLQEPPVWGSATSGSVTAR